MKKYSDAVIKKAIELSTNIRSSYKRAKIGNLELEAHHNKDLGAGGVSATYKGRVSGISYSRNARLGKNRNKKVVAFFNKDENEY